jgi:putative tricarboxylic transport membrane protein
MNRRNLMTATLALALMGGAGAFAPALAVDDLRIIAPAAPGGGWDQTARALEEVINANSLAKTVTVENVPGAGGTVGLAQLVDKEKGNGNVLMVNGLVMVGAIITNKSPATLEQVTPIARLTGEYEVVVVPASSKIKTMKELADQLKANPGSVAFGGGSAGGTDHILAAMIAQAVGADPSKINYIAYAGGGEALAAILGGHVAAGISGYGEFAGQIKSGKMRALAISSEKRVPGIDIPTLREQGIDVDLANWRGVFAPPGITDAQRKELIDVMTRTVKSPAWQATLKKNEWEDLYMSGDAFKSFLDKDIARVTKIIESVGLVKK